MKKKYYVEFVFDNEIQEQLPEQYFAQSGWKGTEKEALEWATSVFHFFFTNFDYQAFTECLCMFLMSSEFDEEDEYSDIDQESRLFYDHHKCKVVKEKDFVKERIPF